MTNDQVVQAELKCHIFIIYLFLKINMIFKISLNKCAHSIIKLYVFL